MSEILLVHKDNLRPNKAKVFPTHKLLVPQASIVRKSVELRGYDKNALPILVFEDSKKSGFFIALDGRKRLEGAQRNSSISKLKCVVVVAKNLSTAQKMVNAFNAPIQDIRERKNLLEHVIDMFDAYFKENPRKSDLAIPNRELLFLEKTTGESRGSLNRMLPVLRDIFNDIVEANPDCNNQSIKTILLDAAASENFPELTDFYLNEISVQKFCDSYYERKNKLEPNTLKTERREKQKQLGAKQLVESMLSESITSSSNGDAAPPPLIACMERTNFVSELFSKINTNEDESEINQFVLDYFDKFPSEKIWAAAILKCLIANKGKLVNSFTTASPEAIVEQKAAPEAEKSLLNITNSPPEVSPMLQLSLFANEPLEAQISN